MNQILMIENKKNKRSSRTPADIKAIVRFFSVAIILFGIFMIGQGTYALVKDTAEKADRQAIPIVDIQRNDSILTISVSYKSPIERIVYNWNNGDNTILQGRGRNQITEEIALKAGNNTLNVTVIATDGKQAKYEKQYIYEKEDTDEPKIEIKDNGDGTVKITAQDNVALKYIKYSWNGGEETQVDANEQNSKQIEEKVQVAQGQNTLKVTAVDTSDNEKIEEVEIKGTIKPKLELYQSGDRAKLIIVTSDEEGIDKVEGSINGKEFTTEGQTLEGTNIEFELPLDQGNNDITVTVYNKSGVSETQHVTCTY